MKIDAHHHFWNFDPVRDAWIDDSMAVLRKDFLPEDLSLLLKANRMDGCIAVQADQSEQETEFLLDLAQKHPFIKGVVGWVDLLHENCENRLNYFSAFKKLKGIRHIVQDESAGFMLRDDFQQGLSKLNKFELVYEILIYSKQLEEAVQLVKNHPNQVFVLDHLGKPNIKDQEIASWEKNIRDLAQLPNVYCKISGVLTEADWNAWAYEDFLPYFDILFDVFGTKRILFGSDWPVCLVAGNYEEVVKLVEKYISKFSKEEQAAIMGENAMNVYNLKR